jgi:hypothetical protein
VSAKIWSSQNWEESPELCAGHYESIRYCDIKVSLNLVGYDLTLSVSLRDLISGFSTIISLPLLYRSLLSFTSLYYYILTLYNFISSFLYLSEPILNTFIYVRFLSSKVLILYVFYLYIYDIVFRYLTFPSYIKYLY